MAIWTQLLPELEVRVLSFLDPNELAGSVRLVCKATAALLPGPKHTAIRLSQRVPPHAFAHRWGQPGAMRSLTYEQRLQLLCLTAASGSIPNLEFLLPRVGCLPTAEVLAAAAAAGQLAVCQWLRQRGCHWEYEAAEAAGKANCREVVEWLIAAGCPDAARQDASGAAHGAARGGHVGLLEWLLPRCEGIADWDAVYLVAGVAEGCDLATLQRAHATLLGAGYGAEGQGAAALPASAMDECVVREASDSPTPDWRSKVEWLLAAGYPRCMHAWAVAVGRPDGLERLAWLRARGFPVLSAAAWSMRRAAARGDFDTLERLIGEAPAQGHGDDVDYWHVAYITAQHGNVAVLRALHEQGRLDSHCVRVAAEHGQLSVVAWAVEALGVEEVLTSALFECAAASGSVELMAWLRERGCPWSSEAFKRGVRLGCEEALEWLAAQGCPMEEASCTYAEACRQGDLATLACLRRLGCPWDADVFTQAVREMLSCLHYVTCPLPALRWLVENGCPVDWDRALEAGTGMRRALADADSAELIAWLEEGKRRAAARQAVSPACG